MKEILAEAINGIDWNVPESLSYILHNKRSHETYYRDNILNYLTLVSELKFHKEKLIDGVKHQKIDLIEENPSFESNHFIIEPSTKEKIPVVRFIEFGHNGITQPHEYNINKSLSDIKKRLLTQELKNELFTVQIVLDIKKQTKQKTDTTISTDSLVDNSSKIKSIDADYLKLDPEYVKIPIHLNDGANIIDLYFYICGPFNKDSWTGIQDEFKTYKTTKGQALNIIK